MCVDIKRPERGHEKLVLLSCNCGEGQLWTLDYVKDGYTNSVSQRSGAVFLMIKFRKLICLLLFIISRNFNSFLHRLHPTVLKQSKYFFTFRLNRQGTVQLLHASLTLSTYHHHHYYKFKHTVQQPRLALSIAVVQWSYI